MSRLRDYGGNMHWKSGNAAFRTTNNFFVNFESMQLKSGLIFSAYFLILFLQYFFRLHVVFIKTRLQ